MMCRFRARARPVGGAGVEFPELGDKPSLDGPNRPDGIYVIRFRHREQGPRSKKFPRGHGYQGRGGADFNLAAPGFGEAYKKAVTDPKITTEIHSFGGWRDGTTMSKSIQTWWTHREFQYFELA
jgi:hypothetical protein